MPRGGSSSTAGPKSRRSYRRKSIDLARRALQVASGRPGQSSTIAAFVLGRIRRGHRRADRVDRPFTRRSTQATPSGWYWSAILRLFDGQPDLAIEHLRPSLRLSPRDRIGTPLTAIGAAYFCQSPVRRSGVKAAPAIRDRSELCADISLSCRPAMPIWGGSTRRERSSKAAGDHRSGRVAPERHAPSGTPSTASCFCRGCGWRRVKHDRTLSLAMDDRGIGRVPRPVPPVSRQGIGAARRKVAAGQDRRPRGLARARRYRRVVAERAGSLWRAGRHLRL